MENQNTIRISIPKPCHEDWNKMSLNEKGGFCSKCAKTVVDFTKKTSDEIKDFFSSQTEKKICGRFMNDQLHDTSPSPIHLLIPVHLLPKKLSFSKIFAFSLFIVFGTSLFSCSTRQGEVVGKISVVTDSNRTVAIEDTSETKITGDTTYVTKASRVKNTNTNCTSLKGDVAVETVTLGEVVRPADTVIIKKDTILREEMTTGKIKMDNKK